MSDSDDRTQIRAPTGLRDVPSAVVAAWSVGGGPPQRRKFTDAFLIGRHLDCGLQVPYDSVSRRHARVYPEGGAWWIRDLGSANGTYLNGVRVGTARLTGRVSVRLGIDGPIIGLMVEGEAPMGRTAATVPGWESAPPQSAAPQEPAQSTAPTARHVQQAPRTPARQHVGARAHEMPGGAAPPRGPAPPPPPAPAAPAPGPPMTAGSPQMPRREGGASGTTQTRATAPAASRPAAIRDMADYYFRDTDDDDAGEHTQMVRQAFRLQRETEQRRHRRRTTGMLAVAGVLLVLLAVAVGTIVWQHQKVAQARALAIDLFYDIKTLEIHLAQVEERVRRTQETRLIEEMESNRARLREMARRYQQYVDEMETEGPAMSEEDLAILRVARIFGECELNMPEAFKEEVKAYIGKWKSSQRLERAMRTLRDKGYLPIIQDAMREQELPGQFLYLALQESNFNAGAIGPETAYGIAKGAWQFIPATAERFGLTTGPLKGVREYDPLDQRFNFEAATRAAARYLRSIYNTDAQASGLLVMASYNWGEGNIIKRIRTLPKNPRQRNFWELVNSYKIPDETYDYVLHIVSAAVIGENPSLFGFDFENPLGDARADGLVGAL